MLTNKIFNASALLQPWAWKAERQISRLLFLEEGARLCFGNPKTPRSTMRAKKFCSQRLQKVSVPTVGSA